MRWLLPALLAVAACAPDDPLPSPPTSSTLPSFEPTLAAQAVPTPTTVPPSSTTSTSTTTTTTTTTTVPSVFRDAVEQWRPKVTMAVTHFGGDQDDVTRFLRIMQCESGGDPDAKNPNSSASGLMQHLTRYWPDRSERAGRPGADVFDPDANIWVSAWLALAAPEGGWQHWVCR